MAQQSDEELIRGTLEGNQSAFAELVRRYQRRVSVTVKSIIGDLEGEDLADIVQEIFLLLFKALPSFRGESQFGTYLTRIALRHCYRESKRRRKRRSIFHRFDSHDPERDPPEARLAGQEQADREIIAGERQTEVLKALQELPEEFRTVLVLRVIEEMPVEEVAESLGISTGTVKSRLYRAKEKMRELLAGSELEFQYNLE
jgi:RNA polymerase sigma-70 factor (ECF subfamily)